MPSSPLVLTYNLSNDQELTNYFVNTESSPLPGTTDFSLYALQSPNLDLKNVLLTVQFNINQKKPLDNEKTSLIVVNVTVIASVDTNTLGTLSWTQQYLNPVPGNDPIITRARVSKVSSTVNSASGIFVNYLFGNVITVYDNSTGNRTIYIYSSS